MRKGARDVLARKTFFFVLLLLFFTEKGRGGFFLGGGTWCIVVWEESQSFHGISVVKDKKNTHYGKGGDPLSSEATVDTTKKIHLFSLFALRFIKNP